jgi:hypothetical protein
MRGRQKTAQPGSELRDRASHQSNRVEGHDLPWQISGRCELLAMPPPSTQGAPVGHDSSKVPSCRECTDVELVLASARGRTHDKPNQALNWTRSRKAHGVRDASTALCAYSVSSTHLMDMSQKRGRSLYNLRINDVLHSFMTSLGCSSVTLVVMLTSSQRSRQRKKQVLAVIAGHQRVMCCANG